MSGANVYCDLHGRWFARGNRCDLCSAAAADGKMVIIDHDYRLNERRKALERQSRYIGDQMTTLKTSIEYHTAQIESDQEKLKMFEAWAEENNAQIREVNKGG